jgi:cysteine desulfuration protein SufE
VSALPGYELAPAALSDVVRDFAGLDRTARMEQLLEYADRFEEVPPEVAARPFPEANRAPRCESEAYVFAVDRPDGTLAFHFAVENPQGLSAKAWAAILDEALSGAPLEQVAQAPYAAITDIYGRELSMGKGQGLAGMLDLVHHAARTRLAARRAAG